VEKPSQFVDISKFPPDERPHILELAEKHNALSVDVDKISGVTAEEKADMHNLFALVRTVLVKAHSKRANIFLATAQAWVVVYILKAVGVDIARFGPVINRLLDTILK